MSSFFKSSLLGTALFAISTPSYAELLSGSVRADAEPLEGAIVRVEGTTFQTSTRSDGTFRIPNIAPGDYTLTIDYFGTPTRSQPVRVVASDGARVDIVFESSGAAMETITVTGLAGSLYAGISQQRASDSLISVLSADALGQFPDQNIAEAARRISGVSVANDQGEGRFVIIRGLDPALNATSVNGVRLPAPEIDTRAVALDVIDADVLQSVVVQKSLTADRDGDGIGGSINIKTLSAFDTDGMLLRGNAEGIYSNITEDFGEKFSITASKVFAGNKLGVAGSLSWNRRAFGSDNRELDGGLIDEDGIFYPEELELRDYIVERRRLSGTLNIDLRAWDNHELYMRTLYNAFKDTEERQGVENEFEGLVTQNGSLVTIALDPSFDNGDGEDPGIGALRKDIVARDRIEEQKIYSIQFGGQSRFDALTIDYNAAYSHAEEAEPERIETLFRSELEGEGGDSGAIGYNLSDLLAPTVRSVNLDTTAFFDDANNYAFEELEFLDGFTEEDEFAFQLDARYDTQIFGSTGFYKAGAKVRLREKSADATVQLFDGFDSDDDLLLAQFEGSVDYPIAAFGPAANISSIRSFFEANMDSFELDALTSAADSNVEDYNSEENIFAGYVMAQVDLGPAKVTGAVRVEHTDFTGTGFFVTQFEEPDGDIVGEIIAGDEDEGVAINAVTASNSYTDVLPSVNVKYEINDQWIARAAYYASIARPSLFSATPTVAAEIDGDEIEAAIGNPDINRQRANNFDLAIEYYPSSKGALNLGVFYKDIRDFFATQVFQDFTFNGVTYAEAEQVVNLSDTQIFGLEASYQQSFEDILPGPLSGLVFGANYTFIDSEAFVGDGDGGLRQITAPLTSKHIGNMVLGYAKYGFDIRLSMTYRSEYLDSIDEGGAGVDRFIDDHMQLDLVARYNINDHLQINGQLVNINNRPLRAFLRSDDFGTALSQFEEYGITAKFGLRYTY